jgi:hypothetical protein
MDDVEPELVDDAAPRGAHGGPHRRAALRRIPWLALVFVALAVADLYWMLRQSDFLAGMSIGDVIGYGLRVTPGIAAILMPAAVLASHRDTWRRIPTVVFGTVLFASVQGLAVVADPLQPIFASLTPASDELPALVPLAALFDAIVSLVSVLGVTYIALGLVQARRYEDRPATAVAFVVPVAGTLATIVGVLAASKFDFGGTPLTPPLAIYLATTVALGILRVVAWAYLAAVVIRGWWSGEQPNTGWWLAVLATALVLVALALVNISGILDTADATFVTAYGYVTASAYTLGHLCLLAAFAVGLPTVDAPEDEDEDEDADASDHEDASDDDDDLDEPVAQAPSGRAPSRGRSARRRRGSGRS